MHDVGPHLALRPVHPLLDLVQERVDQLRPRRRPPSRQGPGPGPAHTGAPSSDLPCTAAPPMRDASRIERFENFHDLPVRLLHGPSGPSRLVCVHSHRANLQRPKPTARHVHGPVRIKGDQMSATREPSCPSKGILACPPLTNESARARAGAPRTRRQLMTADAPRLLPPASLLFLTFGARRSAQGGRPCGDGDRDPAAARPSDRPSDAARRSVGNPARASARVRLARAVARERGGERLVVAASGRRRGHGSDRTTPRRDTRDHRGRLRQRASRGASR